MSAHAAETLKALQEGAPKRCPLLLGAMCDQKPSCLRECHHITEAKQVRHLPSPFTCRPLTDEEYDRFTPEREEERAEQRERRARREDCL